MSAWMITDDHADLIATAYIALVDKAADPQAVGRELLHENMRSLCARYGSQVDHQHLEAYRFRAWPGELDPMLVNVSVACADYQACEHDEWRDTDAYKRIAALYAAVGGEEAAKRRPSNLPWGIEPEHRTQAALLAQGVDKRPAEIQPDIDDFNWVGSRHHY